MRPPLPPREDPVTGLLTSAGLERALDAELARAARHERPLSVVLLAVSSAGPGDPGSVTVSRLARTVARAIEARIRAEDLAARIGALTFCVVAVETAESETLATDLAKHVWAAIGNLEEASAAGIVVTVGAADCQYDELSRAELLREAEQALSTAAPTSGYAALQSKPPRSAATARSDATH